MGSPTGYTVSSYGEMINCEPRMSAYAAALRAAVTPGCTVIDIGAGPGLFSILACQFGAGSVVAIEPHASVELLRQFAKDNGYSDKITIFQGLSTNYRPSVKADVIVSDIRGCLPLFEDHIQTIVDARERLLGENGKLIPLRDSLRIAVVNHPDTYRGYEEPWVSNKFGVDLLAGHSFAVNTWTKIHLEPSDLLSEPQVLAVLDYRSITDSNLVSTARLMAETSGMAHGLLIWFDAELAPDIGFSNAPGEPQLIYGQSFFPFERPVGLAPGDQIEVKFKANVVGGSYVFSWNSRVLRISSAKTEATFQQSTFLGEILSPSKLAKRSPRFAPPARKAHAVDSHCLALFDGRTTLQEIADRLAADFPESFKGSAEALTHVADLNERYSQSEIRSDPQELAVLHGRDELQ